MGENSFESCSNYFDQLRCKTREIDEGIDRLTMTWQTPKLFIGGYAERTAKTNAYLRELQGSVQDTNDAVEKTQSELETSLKQTDQFLEESREIYKCLKKEGDNIEIVLAEYGYRYEEDNDNTQENSNRDGSRNHTNNSGITSIDEIPDMEVEFTPYLTWKCKARHKESGVSISKYQDSTTKSIATPVIKSLASVLRLETPTTKNYK